MFKAWPKIPRIENRKELYTEKIDGTNACIIIQEYDLFQEREKSLINKYGINNKLYCIWAQSRTRLIYPHDDNYGFASWVKENAEELIKLGPGYHYGEWWGKGIQRGYGQDEKIFSLFNTARDPLSLPACVRQVPIIQADTVEEAKQILINNGSLAAPGFMDIEGVVVFDYNTKTYWKAIINK